MKRVIIAAVVLALTAPATAQPVDHRPIHRALVAYVTTNGFDLATTADALAREPRAEEGNPLYGPLARNPLALAALKIALTAVTAYVMDRVYVKRPKLTTAVVWVMAGVIGAVAVHNYTVVR